MKIQIVALFCVVVVVQSPCQQTPKESDNLQQLIAQKKASTNLSAEKLNAFIASNSVDSLPSESSGTVGAGSLKHGRLVPFSGSNFQYFDTLSYLSGRAFVHQKTQAILLTAMTKLQQLQPDDRFYIMECSNACGGEMKPHRTHQNGKSIDFMTPLKCNGKHAYKYDSLGVNHYWMDFNDRGIYSSDPSYSVDFDLLATWMLCLHDAAKEHGAKIEKIIWKMELKDELFATKNGKVLQQKGVYFAKQLTPLINGLHDDHFHVDFSF